MKFSKTFTLLLTIFLVSISTFSKAQYGNEWINYDQTYYKIKIGAEGIYRIDFQTLSDIGVPISSLNPKNFQLFLNGEEQHIYISGEADEVFDSTDFIEFYGNKNDGWLDKELFRTPQEHDNQYYSLYSDTSIYFLTWNSSSSNRRFTDYYDNSYSGKVSDSYFIHEVVRVFSDNYYIGIPNSNDAAQLFSEYTDGEGYGGSINSSQNLYSISTPAALLTGPNSSLEVVAYSANNNTANIVNNFNHEFGVSIKSKSNLIASEKTLGYERVSINKSITSADLEVSTKIYAGEISFANSFFNIKHIKLNYPRKLDLNNSSGLKIAPTSFSSNYLKFVNYPTTKTSPWVYDFKNNLRVKSDKSGNTIEFNLQNVGNDVSLYIFDLQDVIKVNSGLCSEVKMTNTNLSPSTNYLIISHKKLQLGAEQYKSYRESSSGGNYSAHIVYTEDLYNQFSYGYLHPLGIKHYLDLQIAQTSSLEHVLLLGKGQLYTRDRKNNALREAYNLVPPIGIPASDMLYVGELNASSLKTKVSIGRVPARDNDQIEIYLEKLQAFETSLDEEWKKKIIMLAGGSTPSENAQYQSFLNNYYNIARDTSFGGFKVLFSKNDPIPVQTSITGAIQNELNDGASLLSYFGHGAAQVTEISLGEPDQLNNYGKTPLFLFNGCALGNTYEDLSLAEKFLFEEENGALGWIASTNFGFTFSLYNHTHAIYKKMFQNNYGQGIGVAMMESLKDYGNPNNSLDVIEARQLVYHGDPAFKLYSPDKPDFKITNAQINNLSSLDSNLLNLTVINTGKAISDSIDIEVAIFNIDNKKIFESYSKIKGPFYSSNSNINIPNKLLAGMVKFEVILDPKNDIPELVPYGELNNKYSFQKLFQNKSPEILNPKPNEIVNSNYLNVLIRVPADLKLQKTIIIEWDSTPYFKIPIGTKILNTELNLIEENIVLPIVDKQDYYIRSRIEVNGQISDWTNCTFGVIANESEGWTEGNKWKFNATTKNYLTFDTILSRWEFSNVIGRDYGIWVSGKGLGTGGNRFIMINSTRPIDDRWPHYGINLMVINPDNEERLVESGNKFSVPFSDRWKAQDNSKNYPYNVNGQPCGVYNYNLNLEENQDSFINFLSRIPNNYHLIMLNANFNNVELWKQELWSALEEFGIVKLKSLKDGEPFAVFGQKGTIVGSAKEFLADYNDIITPPLNQFYVVNTTLGAKASSGSISSQIIGPSNKWQELKINFNKINLDQDSFSIDVLGSKDKLSWNIISSTINDSIINLSNIDPNLYPYLKFEITLQNSLERKPASVSRWRVIYDRPTEGIVDFDYSNGLNNDSVQSGEDIMLHLAFRNVSKTRYDSTEYVLYVKNTSNSTDTLKIGKIKPLEANEYIITEDTIKTNKLNGNNDLYLIYNPFQTPIEHWYDNNIFHQNIYIKEDIKNPLLDVVFDGKHILDNDIVSPNTEIIISALDDNPFKFIDNENNFKVTLLKPDGTLDTINTVLKDVTFIPSQSKDQAAQLVYSTSNLPSGTYELNVNVFDDNGNSASTTEHKTKFRVITESSISNLYPYPNPFTTQMKFVYTLTGSKMPDYFKIQIMTVSGKIVREITKDELGTIKLGHNVSEFTWDGTDEFGDNLANGVYLYRVSAKIDGKEINKFGGEDGSEFFNHGIGKIYLMR